MNLLSAPAILSAGYYAFAFVAALRRLREEKPTSSFAPPVSILKPVRGSDERFAEAIASHAVQNYPEYEILFGVSDPADPARAEVEKLARDHPSLPIRLIATPTDAPNRKAGILDALAKQARFPFLLVNDGDILVTRDYLREVIAPLRDERIGLVTCLYRGSAGSFAGQSEALGIATEFAPSVLVARQVGVNEFAMGSTLAFRARELERIGGFAALRDYLADDYQLGKRLTGLGLGVVLARPVVETWLGAGTWREVWKHQIRWARTIRVSRAGGYYGYGITHTVFWCLLALITGSAVTALACYAVRAISGLFIAARVMRDQNALALWWWLPGRDLFGFAVWAAGLVGNKVEWRGERLHIDSAGQIK